MAILGPMFNMFDGWHIVTIGPNGQTKIVYFDSAKSYYDMMGVASPIDDSYYDDEEDFYDGEEDILDEEDDFYDEEEDIYDEMEESYVEEEEAMIEDLEADEKVEQSYDIPPGLATSAGFIDCAGEHIAPSMSMSSSPFSELFQSAASISPKMESTSDSKFTSPVTKHCVADQSAEHPCTCFECFQHYY